MFLSVDIGGTHTRVAISENGKKIDKKEKFHTPQKYDDGIDLIQEAVERISDGQIPKVITLAAASPIDQIKGTLMKPPALPQWKDHPIRDELEHRLRCKVLLENDSALGGLGEAHHGQRRKKYLIAAFITLSTGIGGVRIQNGKLDHRSLSFEPGHQILDQDGRFWPGCGQSGCFEALCSGRGFEMTYGVKPEHCEDSSIWEEHARKTSQGLINTIVFWSPDVLVIGGSMVKAGKKFTDPLIKFTKENLKIYEAPEIEISTLEDENTLLGGFIYQASRLSLSHFVA